jgi:hypothetical protein
MSVLARNIEGAHRVRHWEWQAPPPPPPQLSQPADIVEEIQEAQGVEDEEHWQPLALHHTRHPESRRAAAATAAAATWSGGGLHVAAAAAARGGGMMTALPGQNEYMWGGGYGVRRGGGSAPDRCAGRCVVLCGRVDWYFPRLCLFLSEILRARTGSDTGRRALRWSRSCSCCRRGDGGAAAERS